MNDLTDVTDFTMQDLSSKPYAWMFEGVDFDEIVKFGVREWIFEYVKNTISATNWSDELSDDAIFKSWVESGELGEIEIYLNWLGSESLLSQVMTSSEIESEFNLSQSTVVQAIHRGQIPARKSGGVWLVLRIHAEKQWGKRKS